MTFLTPGFAWGFLSLALITALYLLRRRYLPRQVPSTFLWQRSLKDTEANRPFQRLRKNLMLPLQLLAAACLVLALMQPVTGGGTAGKTVLILDLSASMEAKSGGITRLELAKQEARKRLRQLPAGEEVTILGAGEEVRQVLLSSRDPEEAERALDTLEAGRGGAEIDKAVSLARAVCREGETGGDILVISDTLIPPAGVSAVNVGQGAENRAVISLTAEMEGRAWARLANYGEACTVTVVCRADGALCGAQEVEMPAGETTGLGWSLPEGTKRVTVTIREADALAADNELEALVVRSRNVTVALTADSLFLESALKARGNLTVLRADEGNLENTPADLYIMGDDPIRFTLHPGESAITAGEEKSSESGTVTRTGDHPLINGLSLKNVALRSYRPLTGGEAVLRADGDVVLAAAPGEVVLGISLRNTNLALKYDFPILIQNILNRLLPDRAEEEEDAAPPEMPVPAAESDVRHVAPNVIAEGNRTESARGTQWRTVLLCVFLALVMIEFVLSRMGSARKR